jgi:hypothetical protein
MTLDEYIKDRDLYSDAHRRYCVYRHVGYRLRERFGIDHASYNLAQWTKVSHACVTREFEVVSRHKQAVFCASMFAGQRVIWVYSRALKMVMTVLRPDEVECQFKYMEALRLSR